MVAAPDCSRYSQPHKGYRHYVGGPRDGEIDHLIHAHPSDYPQTVGSHAFFGPRNWYEIDYDASDGTEVVYRYLGQGKEFPQRPVGAS